MSDKKNNLLPPSVVDLLIFDTYKRNGVDGEESKSISEDEKKMIRRLVDDISDQVESFLVAQKTNEELVKKATLNPKNEEYVKELQQNTAPRQQKQHENNPRSRHAESNHSRHSHSSRNERPRQDKENHTRKKDDNSRSKRRFDSY